LLTESLLVALVGGVLGSVLALWSFRGLLILVLSSLPAEIKPLAIEASPDLRVLCFALALTFAAGILFGLAPALQASNPDLQSALKQDSAGSGRLTGGWLRRGLVSVQVALCTLLMIATGLLIRGLYATETVDPGFEYRNVAVAMFDLRVLRTKVVKSETFQRHLIEQIRSLPGVDEVAQVGRTPLSRGNSQTAFHLSGQDGWSDVNFNTVSPEYFSLLRIPIVRGRNFTAAEMQDTPRTVIVTEATAVRYWRGQDPIGKNLFIGGPNHEDSLVVVGVAKDAQVSHIGQIDSSYIYLPAALQAQSQLQLLVRSRADFASAASAIRACARELAPDTVVRVSRLEQNLVVWRSLSRFVTTVSVSLGGLALVLASIGVYGIVSYAVRRRLREFGIRMMLGASSGEVQRMILRQEMRPVVIGALIGMTGSALVSRILESVLFGVSALDPTTFIGAPLFLLLVTAAAIRLPARRVIRLDPMTTLRYE
jgi:predicted permease